MTAATASETISLLEQARRTVGLPRTQMARLLGEPEAIFLRPDSEVSGAVKLRAANLVSGHAAWRTSIEERIDGFAQASPLAHVEGERLLTSQQAAKALDVGDMDIANLRKRGRLAFEKTGHATYYRVSELKKLLEPIGADMRQGGPLASAFLSWLEGSD